MVGIIGRISKERISVELIAHSEEELEERIKNWEQLTLGEWTTVAEWYHEDVFAIRLEQSL